MNTMIALPIAAAVPTPAPAMPADRTSPAAALARAEEVVSLLRTCHVREGWKVDEAAAERALAYCRAYGANGSDPDDEREAAGDFFFSHGQSLDWIFRGDPRGLICGRAAHSKRASSLADAELLKLAEEYINAEQKYCDLIPLVEKMEVSDEANPCPEVLRWREHDAALGLPFSFVGADPWFDRPYKVDKLRKAEWTVGSKIESEDEFTVSVRKFAPSEAARARANEIIAVFEQWWQKRCKPQRGYKKAQREADRAEREYRRLEDQIAETRAKTFEGMLAKVRCAQAYVKGEVEIGKIDPGATPEAMALSIFDDLIQSGDGGDFLPAIVAKPKLSDPTFALIEAHKAAEREHAAAADHLEKIEQKFGRVGKRWTAARARYSNASDQADVLALRLVNEPPVSVEGVAALLSYAAEVVDSGATWPDMETDETGQHGWQHHVIATAAAALRGLNGAPTPAGVAMQVKIAA